MSNFFKVYEYNALEKYGVPCAAKKVRIERNTLSDKVSLVSFDVNVFF